MQMLVFIMIQLKCVDQTESMSRVLRKLALGFPTWSNESQAVPPQKMVRDLKFRIKEVEGLFYHKIVT